MALAAAQTHHDAVGAEDGRLEQAPSAVADRLVAHGAPIADIAGEGHGAQAGIGLEGVAHALGGQLQVLPLAGRRIGGDLGAALGGVQVGQVGAPAQGRVARLHLGGGQG